MTATTFRSDGVTNYPKDPGFKQGKKMRSTFFTKTVTSASSAIGDVYILGGPYTMDTRIAALMGALPAFTSATSCDLGFYKTDLNGTFSPAKASGGAELCSAVDLSSSKTYQELLSVLNTSLDRTKNIGDLLSLTGESQPASGIYLGLRFNVANTAASVLLALETVVEEANTH